jgi:hypothetical protein
MASGDRICRMGGFPYALELSRLSAEWAVDAKRLKNVLSCCRYCSYVRSAMKHSVQKSSFILRLVRSFSFHIDTRSGNAASCVVQFIGIMPALASAMRCSTGISIWSRAWSHTAFEGSFPRMRSSTLCLLEYAEHSKQQSNLTVVMLIFGVCKKKSIRKNLFSAYSECSSMRSNVLPTSA